MKVFDVELQTKGSAPALYKMVENGKLKPLVSHALQVTEVKEAFSAVRDRRVVGKAVITFEEPDTKVFGAIPKASL